MALPSTLYKYESFTTQALENLKNHSLYFASPSGFNDPYDCAVSPSVKEPSDADVERIRRYYLGRNDLSAEKRSKFESINLPDLRVWVLRQGQKVLDKAVSDFMKKSGVTCFSERNDSLLMWGHYGGRFKGFCLGFRTDQEPFSKAIKVRYTKGMPQIDLVQLLLEDVSDVASHLYCTKAFDWGYEEEWRCLHSEAGTAYTYPAEALTDVFLGPDAGFTSLEIIALIVMNQNSSVKLWRGRRSKSEFSVVFDSVTYMPHLESKRCGLLRPGDA